MLAFLPPPAGAPRPHGPEPRPGTGVGILIAAILLVVGMLLPWLRPASHEAPRDAAPARTVSAR